MIRFTCWAPELDSLESGEDPTEVEILSANETPLSALVPGEWWDVCEGAKVRELASLAR